jgi:type IV secretory pathway ATPase VirB11/archaellum biosynthesis ATPase
LKFPLKLRLSKRTNRSQSKNNETAEGRPEVKLRFRVEPLVAVSRGNVLTSYQVDQALVTISEDGGRGFYIVAEPPLTFEEKHIYSLLMENLYFSLRPIAEVKNPIKYVEGFIWEAAEELGLVDKVQQAFPKYRYYVARDAFGYGAIHIPMIDPDIEEISCTGVGKPVTVIHRRLTEFDWLDTNIVFESEDELRVFVQRLAQRVGKSVTVAVPFTDAITREGHRLAITFADEVTLPGSTFNIRKFPEEPLSMAHIIRGGTLTPLMAAYLWLIAENKGYIIILGGMGTGKTTLLNCILTMLPPTAKIATIEDSVTRDAKMMVLRDGRIQRTTIGELVDSVLKKGYITTESGHEVGRADNIFVLTLEVDGKVSFKKPDRFIRHKVKKECLKITTSTGREVEVTADHSLFSIDENGEIAPVKCKQLKVSDILVVPRKLPAKQKQLIFNLASNPKVSCKYVLDGEGFIYVPHASRVLRQKLPSRIVLDNNIGFLVGVWLADGFYNGKSGVGFSVGRRTELAKEVKRIADKLGLRVTYHSDEVSLLINSTVFNTFFREILGLIGNDKERRVPEIFYIASDDVISALLKGYFSGDANITKYEIQLYSASLGLLKDIQTLLLRFGIIMRVHPKKRKVGSYGGEGVYRASISGAKFRKIFKERIGVVGEEKRNNLAKAISSRSKVGVDFIPLKGKLFKELKYSRRGLCKKLGKKNKFVRRLQSALRMKKVARDDVLRLGKLVSEFRDTSLYKLANSDIYFDRIISIDKRVLDGYVYDLGVPGTENFICNNIICHNTPEIKIPHQNWQRFKSRSAYGGEGARYEVTLLDLVKLSLRYRPDYISVGEARGEEIVALNQAALLGHGSFTTFHAESPEAALQRMRNPPLNVPEGNLMHISCLVQLARVTTPEGRHIRRVVEVVEVIPGDKLHLSRLFTWDPRTDSFQPESPVESVDRSVRLGTVMKLTGLCSEEICNELVARTRLLAKLVEEGKMLYKEFSEAVLRYHVERRERATALKPGRIQGI